AAQAGPRPSPQRGLRSRRRIPAPWYLPMWVSRLRPLTSPTAFAVETYLDALRRFSRRYTLIPRSATFYATSPEAMRFLELPKAYESVLKAIPPVGDYQLSTFRMIWTASRRRACPDRGVSVLASVIYVCL